MAREYHKCSWCGKVGAFAARSEAGCPLPGMYLCVLCKEVVVEKLAPSFAGVCTSCMSAFDSKGLRTRVLTEEQFRQFKCRGLCLTCKAVKAAVIEANRDWQGGAS